MSMDTNGIKALLAQYSLAPNKALGQNFLADREAAGAIARYACRGPGVIEIGPGLGSLTEELVARAPRVTAVEIDAAMADILRARQLSPNLTVITQDFLKADLPALIASLGGEAAVAANLPYYATTPICMKLMQEAPRLPLMALMMQREAAERFTARPGDRVYGPLSVLAQYHYNIERIMELSPAAYYPQPEVHSAVLGLVSRGAPPCPGLSPLLERAFAMRRKTLWNNLKAAGYSAARLKRLFSQLRLRADIRAEALTVEEFAAIAREIYGDGE